MEEGTMSQEPRIYAARPAWEGLEEIERTKTAVWFKTFSGRMMVPLDKVEKHEALTDREQQMNGYI